MPATKYIRPMTLSEIIGMMYRLYIKLMFPIVTLNSLIGLITLSYGLFSGLFVGPVLLMTSNAILGKSLKVGDSFRRGIFSASFFKMAFVAIGYLLLLSPILFALVAAGGGLDDDASLWTLAFCYVLFSPLWIFIPMIMLLEKRGLFSSIRRSLRIIRKSFSRVLGMTLFINVVFSILTIGLAIPFGTIAASVVITIFLFFITGFSSFPYVFIYYEYRARHENYSEELLAQELGYQPIEEMMTV